ncbi:FAD/NAD(P)-binding oxidoreductase [Halothiobacillus sp. 15-55-196]|uniref:NAD(P)/FAD-dependent oxidoreductase n=1 Tax=Halothiobacillus sp. 15-55-196 TaxID=1970382 RepID=UPI0025BBDE61|nr:FAD/NAD(P)-binding oxidoreductase [Halothiobacillus sp. 15-55-196]
MAHIVILGAGIGGLPAAYEVRQELGKEHKVTVVTADTYFQFIPSNPWVAVGWRNRDDITFPLAPYLERKGIDLISQRVDKIVPTENRLELANGETVTYDYLIITTGAKLMFSAIEGSGPHGGYTQSICTVDHAEHCYENFKQLLDKPGPVIVGAMPGASCYGPAYEYVFILDTALRKKKIRNKVPITFVTAEPYIGHLGLGGVGDSNGMLESELRAHDIKWITNAKTTKVLTAMAKSSNNTNCPSITR